MNVLVLAPHPDDEAIGCGGALCLHADTGDRITVVFLTSGELGLKDLPRDQAWKIREAEARAAGKILGVQELVFLHYPDSQLATVVSELIPVLQGAKPELVYMPHAHEWHPDHKATVAIARQLKLSAEFRAYEIWTPLQQVDEALDITAVWERKLAAVR